MTKAEKLAFEMVKAKAKKEGATDSAINIGRIWILDFMMTIKEARILILKGKLDKKVGRLSKNKPKNHARRFRSS